MKRYRKGDIIEVPKSNKKRIRIGGNVFLNLSIDNEITKSEQSILSKHVPVHYITDIGDWTRNRNWYNYYARGRLLYNGTFNIQNYVYQHSFASNGKSGSDLLMVILGNSTSYDFIVGNYDDNFTKIGLSVEAYSVTYHPPTDMWFFGCSSGKVYWASDADLKAGTSPTQIPGTPVSGFTHTIGSIYSIEKTGTLIHTSYDNEIARSTDDGVTWTNVGATNSRSRGIAEDADGNLVIITDDSNKQHKSLDDGLTWSDVPYINGSGSNCYRIGVNKTSGRFMWSANNNNIYTIDDINGSSYIQHTFLNMVSGIINVNGRWYVSQKFTSSNSNLPFLYISDDDGETWIPISRKQIDWHAYDESSAWLYYDGISKLLMLQYTFEDCCICDVSDSNIVHISNIQGSIDGVSKLLCIH